MFQKRKIRLYKILAILCTVVLCIVQFLHIRNIYKLEEEVYNVEEKKIIKSNYETAIINDKVYPGAVKIIDSFIYHNFAALEAAHKKGPQALADVATAVCDSLFTALKAGNNLDSLLTVIINRNSITSPLVYALFIDDIDIAPTSSNYITIFNKANSHGPYGNTVFVKGTGIKLGGTLNKYNKQTLASTISISTPEAPSYRMRFTLYCDREDHVQQVILKTLPETLLSVFSIVAILSIFFYTFSNWIKQRKETELKSDFINTINHEFQTPLTAIMLANKTIDQENETLQNKKLPGLTAIIRRQTERLSILVGQVAGNSTERPIQLKPEEHSVHEILDDIVADYQLNTQNNNTTIVIAKEATCDRVVLDKLHFTSIVLNIINNGIKHNHKEQKEIHIITDTKNGGYLVLSIKDNGDGMENSVKNKMFEKFFRCKSLVSDNEPGLGLGLYYTKQCLDAHGWSFDVKTKPDAGTEFIIYLPLKKE
jgi:two-component system, OmpR family, phosphate regulon sensor histidine kinase PhoR